MDNRRPVFSIVYALVILAFVVRQASAHQSLTVPRSVSRLTACRIGFGQYCPGPCPRKGIRLDVVPNNPALTVRRNQMIHVKTMANNHEGGFSRWTIVHVRDMHNRRIHARNTFLWSCADTLRRKCNKRFWWRDCYYDLQNNHYNHYLKIPNIYPDGVYVLGWVWIGGGGTWGHFGDYYDCTFIRIKGGPGPWWQYKPKFIPGPSHLARHGKCRATVNKVGVCWKEPCPGGGKYTKLFKPEPFTNKRPRPLKRSMFRRPYRIPKSTVKVASLTIRSSYNPRKVYWSSLWGAYPYLHLTKKMRPTITCETRGNVRSVTFYYNGIKGRTDHKHPYSIAGDWELGWKVKVTKYARWMYNIDRKVTVISCVARGWDGTEGWKTIELSTK